VESKVLNFPDAMKLAEILDKYFPEDLQKADPEELVFSASPADFTKVTEFLSSDTKEEIVKYSGRRILKVVSNGLKINRVTEMVALYRGMTNG